MGLLYHHSLVKGCSPRSDQIQTGQIQTPNNPSVFVRLGQRNTQIKESIRFGPSSSSSKDSEASVQVKDSSKPKGASSEQDNRSRCCFYREVDMSDLPSQYVEDIETFWADL